MSYFRGDSGKFRRALKNAGFKTREDYTYWNSDKFPPRTIYSDTYSTTRRLKLDIANDVAYSHKTKRAKLVKLLKQEFGNRFIRFETRHTGWWIGSRIHSALVYIKQEKS